ncbi:hypothetical protein YPPY46_2238, partial [Yersinia pestis PY-46]
MQHQQNGMPGQFTALMICPNTFKQFRQPLQRQGGGGA